MDPEAADRLSGEFHRCSSDYADGCIHAVAAFGHGGWDAGLSGRHAAEAPMVEGRS